MKKAHRISIVFILTIISCCRLFSQEAENSKLRIQFKTPPFVFRPIVAAENIYTEVSSQDYLKDLYENKGFGAVMITPTTAPKAKKNDSSSIDIASIDLSKFKFRPIGLLAKLPPEASPWLTIATAGEAGVGSFMSEVPRVAPDAKDAASKANKPVSPEYLSEDYFNRLKNILAYTKEEGRTVVFYDEVGFPSGAANGIAPEKYRRKQLVRTEEIVNGLSIYIKTMPSDGWLMSVVAMNSKDNKRIDLTSMVKRGNLEWKVPTGEWKIMIFNCVAMKPSGMPIADYNSSCDYFDPEAVKWFIDKVYEPHFAHVGNYFNNTINMTFFDDVGIFNSDFMWSKNFNEKFKELTGKDASSYYPALWGDIGPETEAARVAFFDTRAELLANGFPKIVTEWGDKHNIQVSGHTPGSYDIQPVDMNGDVMKYYRSQPIPMTDVIFGHGFGREGYKMVSSTADFYDRPIVAAETFGTSGTTLGYRKMIELYIRGFNRFITASASPKELYGPKVFAEWAGRTTMMLQGGKRVSDIAIFYPIASLEAHYYFDAKKNPMTMPAGTFVPMDADYMAVGEMLLDEVHRDFTFIHPEMLTSSKIQIEGKELVVNNKENIQRYKVLILPGGKVISLKALEKIKSYYDKGGKVIATSLLPSKSSEFGKDKEVKAIIGEMFGIDSEKPMPEGISQMKASKGDGKALFIRKPDASSLGAALENMGVQADVAFEGNPAPTNGNGRFSYSHKVKDGTDIYFFGNSSDDAINTFAELRGKIKPELWNPYTGETTAINKVEYVEKQGQVYTRVPLQLDSVRSVFVVGK